MDGVSRPDHRQLVLYKRWTLRAGASVDDVAALVREHIAPAYRRLSPEVTLHLEVALDNRSIVAIQRWSSTAAHRAATSAGTYATWWSEYESALQQWDQLVDLTSEWSSLEVDLGT